MIKFSKLILVSFLILLTSCRNDNSDTAFNNSQTEPALRLKKISYSTKGYNAEFTSEIKYDINDRIIQITSNSTTTDIIYDVQNRIVQIDGYYTDNPSVHTNSKKYEYIADEIIISGLYSGVYKQEMTLFLNNSGLPIKTEQNVGDSIVETFFEYDNNMNIIHRYTNDFYENNYYSYDDKKNPYYAFPLVLQNYLNGFNLIGKNNVKSIKYFDSTVNQFKTLNVLLEYDPNGYLTRLENVQSVIHFFY